MLFEALKFDLEKSYDHRPIVIIHEEEQEQVLIEILKLNKWRFEQGTSAATMAKIRRWETGVLLLHPHMGRGVDTRFQKDSMVMITATVRHYHQLQ